MGVQAASARTGWAESCTAVAVCRQFALFLASWSLLRAHEKVLVCVLAPKLAGAERVLAQAMVGCDYERASERPRCSCVQHSHMTSWS